MTSPRPAENRDDSVIPVSIVPQWGNGIPQPLTPLVGRQEQIVYVTNLLLREEARLLTLTGPGGTGKSRLAIEIARNLAREEALEVIFVSLGSTREPNLLPSTLAHDLGIRDIASDHALHSLQRVFRARPVLLVLDTFEHLLQAAPFLASLLTTCPDLRILVTSRAALRLGGEHVVAVPPLSLPPPGPCTPEVLATSEAGQLYAVHARMVDPGFSVTTETAPVIATICQRLDGLPLAIELAAARSRTLTPQQLLARLPRGLELLDTNRQDLTGHQRAVQSTIAWSYDLLTPECQRVFHHLGVFSNGFPLDAALAIHGDLPEMTVLDALESLLDNSLLQRTMRPDGELRFFMLETIRMFALDRLAQSPDNAAAHVSHVEWAVALAEQTPLGLMGDADRHVYARLEREHDNLRSAMQWSLQHGNPEHCLRIANAIWSFW